MARMRKLLSTTTFLLICLVACSGPAEQIGEPDFIISYDDPSFTISFDRRVDKFVLETNAQIQPEVELEFEWEASDLTITITEDLTPSQRYSLSLPFSPNDSEDNEWIIDTEPMDVFFRSQIASKLDREYHLLFNYPVDPEQIEKAISIEPNFAPIFDWNRTYTRLDLIPTQLVPNVQYEVTIPPFGFLLNSYPNQAFSWDFVSPPLEVERTQRLISREPLQWQFDLEFNYPMRSELYKGSVTINPTLEKRQYWNASYTALTLFPTESLQSNTNYDFSIVLESLARQATEWQQLNSVSYFKSPKVDVSVKRINQNSRIPQIDLSFNYPMDQASVEAALEITPPFNYTVQWNAANTLASIFPSEPLDTSTEYEIEILETAADELGKSINNTHRSKFTTNNLIEDITYSWETDEPWRVTFGYPIDVDHFASNLYIEPDLEVNLIWNDDHTELEVEPASPILGHEDYALRFEEPIKDADGYPFYGRSLLTFSTPSPILGFENGYRPVNTDQPVTLLFDRQLDIDSARDSLTIEPAVDLDLVWRDKDLILSPPDEGWEEGTRYSLTLDSAVTDSQGNNVIRHPVQASFSVTGPSLFVSFGASGPSTQVIDAAGRRAIHVVSTGEQIDSVRLEIHRISVDQYISFDQLPPVEDPNYYFPYRYRPDFDLSTAAYLGAWELPIRYKEDNSNYDALGEVLLPSELGSGLYVASLVYDDVIRDQILVNLSHAVVVAKEAPRAQGGGQITSWVSDFNDFVMPNSRISIFDTAGRIVGSGLTDEMGIFQTEYGQNSSPYLVVAQRGNEIAISQMASGWDTTQGYIRSQSPDIFYGYLYTDRPIYQPGHTVHYKGIIREDFDVNYKVPQSDVDAELVVRDARGNEVERVEVQINEYGTFSGSTTIQTGALLGDYRLELIVGESTYSRTFKVQEYEKPDFTVSVKSDKETYIVGEPLKLEIDTEYLFGEPLANADIKVRWYELLPNYYYYSFSRGPGTSDNYSWFASERSQSLTTDANGRATIEALAPFGQQTEDFVTSGAITRWGVEVTADDGSNQFNSGHAIFSVYRQLYLPSIQLEKYWYQPGEAIPLEIKLTTPFEEPLDLQEITIAIDRRRYSQEWDYAEDEVFTLATNDEGLAKLDLLIEENGRYRIRLRAVDRLGHVYEAKRFFSVYERDRPWYRNFESELIMDVSDDSYKVGDTVQLIVESAFDGQALLTLERGQVYEERVVTLTSPITIIEVPIESQHVPNIYALLQAWRPNDTDLDNASSYRRASIPDGQLLTTSVEISVPDQDHKLEIQLDADQDVYGPRNAATFNIEVADALGEPVQAEVSLALVDESIFLLSQELAPPIHRAFYNPRGLGVNTYDSLSPRRYLVLADLGGGMGGGGDNAVLSDPRQDFPDTVLWLPTVETDADGKASVSVNLPDTLTSWRLTARAVTKESQVGENTLNIQTRQEVVVSPQPPTSLIEGDSFTFSALIHNFSDTATDFTIRAESPIVGLDRTQDISLFLEAGESQVAVWQTAALRAGDGEIIVSASSEIGSDAVKLPISVAALALPAPSSHSGFFSGTLPLAAAFDQNAHPSSSLEIEISNSIAGSLLSGVEYLTGFPYGCVEQVMSRALPNAVVGRAFNELGYIERAEEAELDTKIVESIHRLYALQHDDGGWGWWYDDDSDPYQTAWVLFGLASLRDAGYPVEDQVLESGENYLLGRMLIMEPRTRAFALYSIAVAGGDGLDEAQFLAENPGRLDSFALAALTIALHRMGDEENAATTFEKLLAEVQRPSDGLAYWGTEGQDGFYRKKTMASQVRTTAIVLSAMLLVEPEHTLVTPTTNWLMEQRRHHGWGTTNETSFALLALTDFILVSQERNDMAPFEIRTGNGDLLAADQFSESTMSFNFSIPINELPTDLAEISLETDSDALLYYNLIVDQYVAASKLAGDGISISRRYLDPESGFAIGKVETGDLVLVELVIDMPEDGYYMLVEDYLPGGLTAINERLNSTSHEVTSGQDPYYSYYSSTRFYWHEYGYNRKEIRGNQVSFFVTRLPEGLYVINYYARATTAGSFSVMPAQITAMYDHTLWGYSSTHSFEIELPAE